MSTTDGGTIFSIGKRFYGIVGVDIVTKEFPLDRMEVPSNPKGQKFDTDKLDWSLLPIEPTEEVIKVLMFGAKKYAPDNWKHVEDYERRYYSAAQRHLTAWKKGDKVDEETGLSHLAHALCCILFLLGKELE